MSVPDIIVAAQLQELLQRLEEDRQRRSTAELASARERARAILRAARTEARRRMTEAVQYERARHAEALALRRAELEAARRREEHATTNELVRRSYERLPGRLERRWQEAAARREWCETALAAAAQRLRGKDWQIEIAPGASPQERELVLARARALRPGAHSLREREELAAGLSVRAEGAALDASVDGLLDDAATIGARFLHEWLHHEARVARDPHPDE